MHSEPLIPDFRATLATIDPQNSDDLKYELSDFLSHKPLSHRLGVYFENLVEFYLKHILKSKTIYAHEKTKNGEIDFIFLDPSSQRFKHWEVALKFYFFEPENNLYWGITRKDRFDIKTDRIINRQLEYSKDTEFCRSLNIEPSLVDRELIYKGRLFYPHGHEKQNENWYVRGSEEFQKLESEYKDSCFRLLTRREWLADPEEFPLSFREVTADPTFATALGIQKPNGNIEHGFILESNPSRSND
ncbi:MAG: DUF1853 family protein [Xanthomonadaceae bacterium]|nr:DUF1853 family protein [Xanthomonadaceae bacterium]